MVGDPWKGTLPAIEEAAGMGLTPIPEELVAFWEVVGSLNFVWNYESPRDVPELFDGVELLELDPLCVDGPESIAYSVETWRDMVAEGFVGRGGQFTLELAPDYLHKANISGGSPYGIQLPSRSSDPFFWGVTISHYD